MADQSNLQVSQADEPRSVRLPFCPSRRKVDEAFHLSVLAPLRSRAFRMRLGLTVSWGWRRRLSFMLTARAVSRHHEIQNHNRRSQRTVISR